MPTYIPFKKFVTLPRVVRAFKSVSDMFRAVKARASYSRVLNGKSRVAGQVDVSATITGRRTISGLRKTGRRT